MTVETRDLINELIMYLDGQVSGRARVIDQLLDIRLAAAGNDELTAEVDCILADMPGVTVVENGWVLSRLEELKNRLPEPVSAAL
ncbi:MAG: hypothetical protein JJLCMIEE_02735 [Acidimicrobiales bacterium]|nr:MAG: hypothetical protein EDR02_14555 [Actinomycetota bacterium]MBV6509639.1 hypothetical protein [Acidimicrobiales bacterium]RIK06333.1 MAG: hypothetical protein DCC48_07880 [Acidobacteriota bacterium]